MASAIIFPIKQGDTLDPIRVVLSDASGPIDVTGATVRFHMGRSGAESPITDAAATIITAAAGVVEYVWQPADTATAGSFNAEFEVTFSPGNIMTFPNDGHITIRITEQVG